MTSTPETEPAAQGLDPDIQDAAEGYQQFQQRFQSERAFFERLAHADQKPRLLWIGCSDSRVVPSEILSAAPGELFEVRNIANTVPRAGDGDVSVGAAIAYALEHLGIDDIVVCGHSGCGGIKALAGATPPEDAHDLGKWVSYTRPAHRLIEVAGVPEADRHLETVKAHIHFQLDNLRTYPLVRERLARGQLDIHGWLYVMERGELLAYDSARAEWRELIDHVTKPA